MKFDEKLFSILDCTKSIGNDVIVLEDCRNVTRQLSGYYIVLRRSKSDELKEFLKESFDNSENDVIDGAFSVGSEDSDIVQCFSIYYHGSCTDEFITHYGGEAALMNKADQKDRLVTKPLNETPLEDIVEPISVVLGGGDSVGTSINEEEFKELQNLYLSQAKELEAITLANKELSKEVERLTLVNSDLAKELDRVTVAHSNVGDLQNLVDDLNSKIESLELDNKSLSSELKEFTDRYPTESLDDEIVDIFINLLDTVEPVETVSAIKMLVASKASQEDEKDIGKIISDLLEQYVEMGVVSFGE